MHDGFYGPFSFGDGANGTVDEIGEARQGMAVLELFYCESV